MRTRASPASLLACLLTASIITGGLLVTLAPVARAATVSVSIQSYAFHPSSVVVVIGVNNTVTWTNNEPPSGYYGCPTHTVTSNDGLFMSGNLDCGASFTYTFMTPGTFGYHCSIHTYMKGNVTVRQASTTTSSTSSSSSTSSATTTSTSTTTSATTATHTSSTPTTATTSSTTTSTSSTTATTSSSSQTVTPSSQPTSTTSGTSSASGGIPEFPFEGALVAALAFALVASYFVVRRSRTPA